MRNRKRYFESHPYSFRSRSIVTLLVCFCVAGLLVSTVIFSINRSTSIQETLEEENQIAQSILSLHQHTDVELADIIEAVETEALVVEVMSRPETVPDVLEALQSQQIVSRTPYRAPPVTYLMLDNQVLCIHASTPQGDMPKRITHVLNVLILFLLSAGIAILISVSRMSKPFDDLRAAAQRVEGGDYTTHLDESSYNGEVRELIGSFNRMTASLNRTAYLQKDFIGNVSHEFRTPISSIGGFARMLQSPDLTPAQRQEYTQYIVQESDRLTRLSETLLRLTALEQQASPSSVESFQLDEQLRSAILRLELQWGPKEIEWSLQLEDDLTVTSDPDLLVQVWTNLLQNAIKFSPQGGEIAVTAQRVGGQARVTITDHGIGMSEETVERIFEPFYQADASRSGSGVGLGLSLVRRILDLLKGDIRVTSAPGQGSAFTVNIPLNISPEKEP